MRRVALDTETTGLDPETGHRIIEIGCVEINDRTMGNTFHSLINPQRPVPQNSIEIHGITNEMVHGQPLFQDIWGELLEFIKDSQLVIHNAPFDLSFLDEELKKMNLPPILKASNCTILDTLEFARSLHPSLRNNLDALSDRYAINRDQRKDRHGALIDADLLAKVYLAMTGGQVAMTFASDKKINVEIGIKVSNLQGELHLIHASEDELKQHDELLQWIDAKADGDVQWKAK